MSFLYPRTVAITRPNTQLGPDDQGYLAATEGNETSIATGLPASIQQTREPGKPEGGTPSDAPNRTVWNIFVPAASLALGGTTERDIVTDDLGKRYVVIAAYWNSLGYRLRCELLEA
jgi:hypothetical protein